MLRKITLLLLTGALVAGLASCGRKGDLEAPGAYENQSTMAPAEKKPTGPDKPFFLDPLL